MLRISGDNAVDARPFCGCDHDRVLIIVVAYTERGLTVGRQGIDDFKQEHPFRHDIRSMGAAHVADNVSCGVAKAIELANSAVRCIPRDRRIGFGV